MCRTYLILLAGTRQGHELTVRLKYEDLIPDTELKARIDAWAAEGYAAPADTVMDVEQL
jgi:hypothetical protein